MHSGFTLAELILVVALTLFLLTVTVQGFVNSASQFTFSNASERVQEMIRSARSLAISGKAQLDYTDFDKDGCFDDSSLNVSPCDSSAPPDYVTPANYGINFSKTTPGGVDTYTVTLFADLHANPSCASGCGQEGVYDSGSGLADYRNGKDVILDQYVLPNGIVFAFPGTGNNDATIFYSPIFADASFKVGTSPVLPEDPFFTFGVSQMQGTILRKRCYEIHKLAGISEPMTATPTTNPAKCP